MIRTAKKRYRTRKGFGLLLAVVMLAILSLVGSSLLDLGLDTQRRAFRTTKEISARAAADAGITKALFEMNKSLSIEQWTSDDIPSSLDATFSTANAGFTCVIEETADDAEYKITSTGQSGGAQKTVSMIVRRQGIFDYGLFSAGYALPKHAKAEKWPGRKKPPKKGGHLKIKGYNVDTYSSNPGISPSGELVIRTNSKHHKAVKLEEGSIINADIAVGPGGNPDKVIETKKGAQVTGDTYPAAEVLEPLPVIVPENLSDKKGEKFEIKKDKKKDEKKDKKKDKDDDDDKDSKPIQLSGNLTYEEFKIEEEQVVEVRGNCTMYVEGEMKLHKGAQLIVTENSSLTLYVGKKLEIKSVKGSDVRALINETHDPTKLLIYGTDTCEKVKLERLGDFYGAVYAPYAKVEVKKNEDVYGAFLGWEVKLEKEHHDDNPSFCFDEALGSSEDGNFRVVRGTWREK